MQKMCVNIQGVSTILPSIALTVSEICLEVVFKGKPGSYFSKDTCLVMLRPATEALAHAQCNIIHSADSLNSIRVNEPESALPYYSYRVFRRSYFI